MTEPPANLGRSADDQMLEWILIEYRVKSERIHEHLELLGEVYEQLHVERPADFHYASFQLDGDVSFVEIAASPQLPGPLPRLEAFQRFRAGLDERCDERATPTLHPVGRYGMC